MSLVVFWYYQYLANFAARADDCSLAEFRETHSILQNLQARVRRQEPLDGVPTGIQCALQNVQPEKLRLTDNVLEIEIEDSIADEEANAMFRRVDLATKARSKEVDFDKLGS